MAQRQVASYSCILATVSGQLEPDQTSRPHSRGAERAHVGLRVSKEDTVKWYQAAVGAPASQ